jgi:polyisoprenyl-phosphate glycosyltransferase
VKIKIVIPAFNDWEALIKLCQLIDNVSKDNSYDCSLVIVNDNSTRPVPEEFKSWKLLPLKIINLNRNMGHQRAIATGLSYVRLDGECDFVLVMDADGEDRPGDIPALVKGGTSNPGHIVFAKRTKRQESLSFRFFYSIYKIIFRILTGVTIEFGNFCIIPCAALKKLVFVSEIWNHFSGGVIKSRLPYSSIPLERGRRIAGQSKMNFQSLILHGMSAVSVHIETVAVRLLLFSVMLISLALVGIILVSYIRIFTSFAIPGWASFLVTAFSIIIFQAFLISLFLVFVVLNYRTQKHFIPANDCKDFIESIEIIS